MKSKILLVQKTEEWCLFLILSKNFGNRRRIVSGRRGNSRALSTTGTVQSKLGGGRCHRGTVFIFRSSGGKRLTLRKWSYSWKTEGKSRDRMNSGGKDDLWSETKTRWWAPKKVLALSSRKKKGWKGKTSQSKDRGAGQARPFHQCSVSNSRRARLR